MQIMHYITKNSVDLFQKWLDELSDTRARIAILRRLDRVVQGNFGDHKSCRDGVSEIRIDVGQGYRIYYCHHGRSVVILLCGGDKNSQKEDINRAIANKADFLLRIKEEK